MPIDLRTHVSAYVTVGELAEYWVVSRRQIYRQIQSGELLALKLGLDSGGSRPNPRGA